MIILPSLIVLATTTGELSIWMEPSVMTRIFNKANKDKLVEFEMTNLLNLREKGILD